MDTAILALSRFGDRQTSARTTVQAMRTNDDETINPSNSRSVREVRLSAGVNNSNATQAATGRTRYAASAVDGNGLMPMIL